ncbi:MAG: hypothetical protein AB7F19_03860 [Candidatus Babeliales bacterium]
MNKTLQVTVLTYSLGMMPFACGMDSASNQPAVKQITFNQAWEHAAQTGDITGLWPFVEKGAELNSSENIQGTGGVYPLEAILQEVFSSDLVATALLTGAQIDSTHTFLKRTFFHWIVLQSHYVKDPEKGFFPLKNLLSGLALPTYGQSTDGKTAAEIAGYRLERAQQLLNWREMAASYTAYTGALNTLNFFKKQNAPADQIQQLQSLVDALIPEGLIERHKPTCTMIVQNVLDKKNPFAGIPPF